MENTDLTICPGYGRSCGVVMPADGREYCFFCTRSARAATTTASSNPGSFGLSCPCGVGRISEPGHYYTAWHRDYVGETRMPMSR